MANRSALGPDDRAALEALIGDRINGHASLQLTKESHDLISDLHAMAEAGNRDVARWLRSLAQDGLNELFKTVAKDRDRTTFKLARSGQVINTPTRIGHRARKDSGETDTFFQQTLWYELTWDEFEVWLDDRIQHRDSLSTVIAAFRSVLALRQKYPQTKTPIEACELAGIDPRDMTVGVAA